jgi:DNA-binding beta-propeller fold protein YncE
MALGRSFAPNSTPQALAVAADGSELYVANEGASRVESYDLVTGVQGTPFATVGGAFGLALSGDVLVATLSGVGKVELFNRVTRERIATVTTGGVPRRPALNAAGTVIVVPNESYRVDFIQ